MQTKKAFGIREEEQAEASVWKIMKIGFIGLGNMGKAMISGIINRGLYQPEDIYGFDTLPEVCDSAASSLHIQITSSGRELTQLSDIIVLAVKPQYYATVIVGVRDVVTNNKIVVTIAPGKSIRWLEDTFLKPVKLVRTMPNTPAMVMEGCTGICTNASVTKEETELVLDIFNSFGKAFMVPENLMDIVVGIGGSSPAYVFMFMEAMADAAVEKGMPRALAYQFISQAVLGSAKLFQESGKHPGELKDIVCTPGGTTIAGVRVLEERGMRSAVINAIEACIDKSTSMAHEKK